MDEPLSARIKDFIATCKALDSDDEKCVVLHELLDAWADAALKLETALHDTRQCAAIRKVEADHLRRQRDALIDAIDGGPECDHADGEKSRGGEA